MNEVLTVKDISQKISAVNAVNEKLDEEMIDSNQKKRTIKADVIRKTGQFKVIKLKGGVKDLKIRFYK